jgi:hypothetical protein
MQGNGSRTTAQQSGQRRKLTLDDQTRGEQLRRIDAVAPVLADSDLVSTLRVLDGVTRGYPNGRPPTHHLIGELMGLPVRTRPHAYRRAAKAIRRLIELGAVAETVSGERKIDDPFRPDLANRDHEKVFHWRIDYGRLLELIEQESPQDAPIMQDAAPSMQATAPIWPDWESGWKPTAIGCGTPLDHPPVSLGVVKYWYNHKDE